MYPEKDRWYYKKELMGREAYMTQLAQQVKAGRGGPEEQGDRSKPTSQPC